MKTIYITAFLVCAINACEKPNFEVSDGDLLIVYIKPKSIANGPFTGNFGDVVLFNTRTQIENHVTNDSFYDDGCKISPMGNKILYVTTSLTPSEERKYSGLAAPLSLILYNIKSRESRKIDVQKLGISNIRTTAYSWMPDNVSIVLTNGGSKIFLYNTDTDTVESQYTVPPKYKISQMFVSPNGKRLAILNEIPPKFEEGIGIFDLTSLQFEEVEQPDDILQFHSWTEDGNHFYYSTGGYYEYSTVTKIKRKIKLPDKITDSIMGEMNILHGGDIIFQSYEKNNNVQNKYIRKLLVYKAKDNDIVDLGITSPNGTIIYDQAFYR